jgi:hypothetical protein
LYRYYQFSLYDSGRNAPGLTVKLALCIAAGWIILVNGYVHLGDAFQVGTLDTIGFTFPVNVIITGFAVVFTTQILKVMGHLVDYQAAGFRILVTLYTLVEEDGAVIVVPGRDRALAVVQADGFDEEGMIPVFDIR